MCLRFLNFRMRIILVISFLLSNMVYSQEKIDTTFLYRSNDINGYKAVFIEKPHSKIHKKVFEFLTIDTVSYNESVRKLKSLIKNKNKSGNNINGEWIGIYLFNKKLYAYLPSEPYFNLYLNISDSIISINDFNDGIIPLLFKKAYSKEDKSFFTLINVDSVIIKMNFEFLNRQQSIALVTIPSYGNRKCLMIRKELFYKLPIIVNYCPNNRCIEWTFSQPKESDIFRFRKLF